MNSDVKMNRVILAENHVQNWNSGLKRRESACLSRLHTVYLCSSPVNKEVSERSLCLLDLYRVKPFNTLSEEIPHAHPLRTLEQ